VDHDTLGIRLGIRFSPMLRQGPGMRYWKLHYRAVRRREDKSPLLPAAVRICNRRHWRTHLRRSERQSLFVFLAVNIATSFHSGIFSHGASVRSVRECFWNCGMVATGWIAATAKKRARVHSSELQAQRNPSFEGMSGGPRLRANHRHRSKGGCR